MFDSVMTPFHAITDFFLKRPISALIYATPWTERFSRDHPGWVALVILGIIYLAALIILHTINTVYLRMFGPTPAHLAAAAERERRRIEAVAADTEKRQQAQPPAGGPATGAAAAAAAAAPATATAPAAATATATAPAAATAPATTPAAAPTKTAPKPSLSDGKKKDDDEAKQQAPKLVKRRDN